MTTRHRRHPDEVTRDRLTAKLRKKEEIAADWKGGWEHAEAECERVRRALADLGMAPLPGLEPEPAQDRPQDDQGKASVPNAVVVLLPPSTCPWVPDGPPHQHRQGVGDDVECVTP